MLAGIKELFFGDAVCMALSSSIYKKQQRLLSFDYYVLLFFLLAFAGWLWEGLIYLVLEGEWINRGAYLGPYLPIYGTGGVLLWILLHRLNQKRGVIFVLSALICSALEYAASAFLEWRWGLRWWDYSGWFMNLNGRICILSALLFGFGGMLLNCYIQPWYMKIYDKIPPKQRLFLAFTLVFLFVLDATYCAVNPHQGYGIAWK